MTCQSVRSQQIQTIPQKHGYPRNPVFEPNLLSGVQGTVEVPPSPCCPFHLYPLPGHASGGAAGPLLLAWCSGQASGRPRMEGPTTTTPASSPSGELCPSPLAPPLQGSPGLISFSQKQLPIRVPDSCPELENAKGLGWSRPRGGQMGANKQRQTNTEPHIVQKQQVNIYFPWLSIYRL